MRAAPAATARATPVVPGQGVRGQTLAGALTRAVPVVALLTLDHPLILTPALNQSQVTRATRGVVPAALEAAGPRPQTVVPAALEEAGPRPQTPILAVAAIAVQKVRVAVTLGPRVLVTAIATVAATQAALVAPEVLVQAVAILNHQASRRRQPASCRRLR